MPQGHAGPRLEEQVPHLNHAVARLAPAALLGLVATGAGRVDGDYADALAFRHLGQHAIVIGVQQQALPLRRKLVPPQPFRPHQCIFADRPVPIHQPSPFQRR